MKDFPRVSGYFHYYSAQGKTMISVLVKRVLGAVALLMGIILIGWFIYNQLWPTDEFKRSFRSVFQLAAPALFILVGWKWLRYEGKGIEEVTPPDSDFPELKDSTARARGTMTIFLAEVDKGVDNAYIKFPMKTPQGFTEHIWAYVHFFKDRHFNVSLANAPFDDKADASGRRNVPKDEVEDWQIMMPDGRIKGAYSLIALFERRQREGKKLSPRMKKQRAQLVDMPPVGPAAIN